MKIDWKAKLSSRKFWAMIIGIVTSAAIALGADEMTVGTVAGAVTSVISAVAYIIVEGKVDAARVKAAVDAVQDAADALSEDN